MSKKSTTSRTRALTSFIDCGAALMLTLNDPNPMSTKKRQKARRKLVAWRRAAGRLPLRPSERDATDKTVAFCRRNLTSAPSMVAQQVRQSTMQLAKRYREDSPPRPKAQPLAQPTLACSQESSDRIAPETVAARLGQLVRETADNASSVDARKVHEALLNALVASEGPGGPELRYERTPAGSPLLMVRLDSNGDAEYPLPVERITRVAWSRVHRRIGLPPIANRPSTKSTTASPPKKRRLGVSSRAVRGRQSLILKDPHCEQCGERVVDLRILRHYPGVRGLKQSNNGWASWTDGEGRQRARVASVHHRIGRSEWRKRGLSGSVDRMSNLALLCIPCHVLLHQQEDEMAAAAES